VWAITLVRAKQLSIHGGITHALTASLRVKCKFKYVHRDINADKVMAATGYKHAYKDGSEGREVNESTFSLDEDGEPTATSTSGSGSGGILGFLGKHHPGIPNIHGSYTTSGGSVYSPSVSLSKEPNFNDFEVSIKKRSMNTGIL
jgi:hypothetical protein